MSSFDLLNLTQIQNFNNWSPPNLTFFVVLTQTKLCWFASTKTLFLIVLQFIKIGS